MSKLCLLRVLVHLLASGTLWIISKTLYRLNAFSAMCLCQNLASGMFAAKNTKEITFGGFSDGSVSIQISIGQSNFKRINNSIAVVVVVAGSSSSNSR